MPDSFDYTTGTNSENVRLLQALIDDAPEYTEETNSRNANILKSIINNTEYTDAPQSEIEELLLRLKAKIGGEIEVDELNVTENGTYDAGVNKAYNPVNVELPLSSKTITENGTYTASDDNLAGYDEVTVAVEGYAKKSIANTPTPIATFNASALPIPSLTVGIEAVQDLHGYDNPWPAGGGKNLFNMGSKWSGTASGLTFSTDDNYVTINGTKNGGTYVTANELGFELSAGTYYVKTIIIGGTASNQPQLTLIGNDISTGDTIENERTFTLSDTTTVSVRFAFWNDGATFNNYKLGIVVSKTPNIDKFYPYSNICPISGWSAVNVTRCGKNLIPYVEFGVLNQTDGSEEENTSNKRTGFIRTLPNTQYTISGLDGSDISIRIFEYKEDKNYIRNYVASNITNSVTIQTGAEVGYIRFQGNETVFASSMAQYEKGNQVTDFEPYNGTTYTTTLKDGQGNPLTCYGGTLSNENGVQRLVNGRVSATYTGDSSEAWGENRSGVYYISVSGADELSMCNIFKVITPAGTSDTINNFECRLNRLKTSINFRNDSITSLADWKTWLSNNPIQVVYELATPQTIPQDNLAIATQDGTNNLWADTGDVLSGEYLEAL